MRRWVIFAHDRVALPRRCAGGPAHWTALRRLGLLLALGAGLGLSDRAQAQCDGSDRAPPYKGRLFDAMAQIDGTMRDVVVPAMDRANVHDMALFARVQRKHDGQSAVIELKQANPDRFVVGTPKRFDLRDDLPDAFVTRTLSQLGQKPYRFVGEILFAHGDKSHGEQTATGERYVFPDAANVQRLMQGLARLGAPVMTHWEVYDWSRDWPPFDRLYGQFPSLTFIWPHAGFGSPDQVRAVLAHHANVMVTLSKREKDQESLSSDEKTGQLDSAIADACGRLRPDWQALLDDYPDRFMFATDAHKDFRWERYAVIVRKWRRILGRLPAALAQAIAWKNAERIYRKPS